ncbi:MAG: xylulokinase [Candidatus Nanopelagicales bacterium]
MGHVIGIDLGTQSVKVAMVGADGVVEASATRPYAVHSAHPGWAESDPEAWLDAALDAANEVLAVAGARPVGIGLSGQMHGVVLCDASGTPVRRAITWADTRSSAEAARIADALGVGELARLGSAPFPGFAGVTLAWLDVHEPAAVAGARWALQAKDWLRMRLAGSVATDPSDASGTLLYDLTEGEWSAPALAACGVRPDLLPPVVGSADLAGEVVLDSALSGLPVAVGGADAACGIHGLGLSVGFGALAVGTGAQLSSVIATPDPDRSLRTHTFATVGTIGEAYYRLAAMQSGGLALERALAWLSASVDEAQRALAEGVRTDDPLFLPFVAGERSPYQAPDLRGSWQGLSLATTRAAMLRSVLEGMAYTVAAGYAAITESGARPAAPLTTLGGGSRDPGYVQLLATAMGASLLPASVADATVVGAARLGGAAVGMSIPPVAVAPHGIVEPTSDEMIAGRQRRWRAAVERELRGEGE